jgi:2,4-dienoyl-CoA reductase-like NADH-dependent reductase (Old Yellow Enzyme family)
MARLFESFKLRDITLRNRIAVSPMCEYSSEEGFANDWHLVDLGSRAVGGGQRSTGVFGSHGGCSRRPDQRRHGSDLTGGIRTGNQRC